MVKRPVCLIVLLLFVLVSGSAFGVVNYSWMAAGGSKKSHKAKSQDKKESKGNNDHYEVHKSGDTPHVPIQPPPKEEKKDTKKSDKKK